jgi:pimeloyl-ACP methyl ester carboxylesterase
VADSNHAAHLFRFDTFEFDTRTLELRRGGAKIKLEGQPLRILGMLVERPGELVTREELRKQLWPGNTIVDFEHSINAAMKRLREAVGDSANAPRFIETLPRRGYRFIYPVRGDAEAIGTDRRLPVTWIPQTKYAKSGDIYVAYQVIGQGARDLVVVQGWVSHVEYAWEDPDLAKFLERLASFSRLIVLDRRGTGLSDRVAAVPTLEQRMDDVRAVMDAAQSERATLLGISAGGPMCMLFAATYPERTASLVLYGTAARGLRAPDYPIGLPRAALDGYLDLIEQTWGTGATVEHFAPSRARDERFRQSWARFERLAVSPAGARALARVTYETDATQALSAIRVPTLILHREGDLIARVAGARYVEERVTGARYVELPGADHFPWVGDSEAVLGEIEEFLTGERRGPELDRVLATVMFTDLVHSTEKIAALGDQRWCELLGDHHALIRKQLAKFRGREIDTAGDGFLAAFDGPARAVRCACAVVGELRRLGLEVRVGVHTGECELTNERLSGIAVHTGARVASLAESGEVLVSATVKDLVAGSGIAFRDRGAHILKGVPGEWQLYAVVGSKQVSDAGL